MARAKRVNLNANNPPRPADNTSGVNNIIEAEQSELETKIDERSEARLD